MDVNQQLLFLFSALGGFNALFLSIYFAIKPKQSNYFLSALLFVIGVRIIKSVFLYFNPGLSEVFIQIGLSACVLIGPFLFLYLNSQITKVTNKRWMIHILPFVIIMILLGIMYPYWEHRKVWSYYIVKIIYTQWLIYVVYSGIQLKEIVKKLFSSKAKLQDTEIWLLSVLIGVAIILIGYSIGAYTSYIVGALTFSFVFFLLLLLVVFNRKKNTAFFEDHKKYNNKKINDQEATQISETLMQIMATKKLYKNPNLKLLDVANELNVTSHYLSQFLNDNFGKSFALFINEYRIKEAKQLIKDQESYTIEAIGYESGFNSKSTFFTTFKKITGLTPANYKAKTS
ncbi:helix-turn-helix domain-containing protein [Aquimarina algicola]|uniref:AraC family transcriptional regulator n=1 Tax=Aquimarina algicola TaxID=2589995 RepID=A0A504JKT8_9FLAO|nr:helix-turn-helix domain-containing protein [Aquimarina algicola]TPN88965.1 AraC family transcriptional regulator [Aquimarina algicola]